MRAAILTTAFVIAALALWANLRDAVPRGERESATAAQPQALPDVAAAPVPDPSVAAVEEATPAAEPTNEPAAAAAPVREHVVVAGETLAGLAQRYYGDATRADEIYAANRDQIRDPEQLHAGQKLLIP